MGWTKRENAQTPIAVKHCEVSASHRYEVNKDISFLKIDMILQVYVKIFQS